MNTKIIQIGRLLDEEDANVVDYYSNSYLLDADIVLIDISTVLNEFEKLFKTRVIKSSPAYVLPIKDYQLWNEFVTARKAEIAKFLENGGNLFVLNAPSAYHEFHILKADNTATKESIDLLDMVLLSGEDFGFKEVHGSNLFFVEPFDTLDKNQFSYNYIYSKYKGNAIAQLVNTKEVVGVCVPYEKGNVVLLPTVLLDASDYNEYQHLSFKFKETLIDLDSHLKSTNRISAKKGQIPIWASRCFIGDEATEIGKLTDYLASKSEIENLIRQQEEKLTKYQELKSLMWESGDRLENMVAEIFRGIGYSVAIPSDNRDDLILTDGENVIVAEIKGVKGSAAERNAAQLSKWVTNYHLDNDVNPKGMLVVNAFKDKPIYERNEQAFPNQMLRYCTQREYLLITTAQLLVLYLDFIDGKLSKEDISSLLMNSVGVFNYDTTRQITYF